MVMKLAHDPGNWVEKAEKTKQSKENFLKLTIEIKQLEKQTVQFFSIKFVQFFHLFVGIFNNLIFIQKDTKFAKKLESHQKYVKTFV